MNALSLILVVLAADGWMSADAWARYRKAIASMNAGRHAEAIAALNALAADYPRVGEVFAARCSALVAAKNFRAAETDCSYALSVDPKLAVTTYTLAVAEEGLGKREQAAAHYREYADLDEAEAPLRVKAVARADALLPVPPATVSKLVVYLNHNLYPVGRLTLALDGQLIGDLSKDEYVEIDAAPGEHMLEARSPPATIFDRPQQWTRPVQLGNTTTYVNFEGVGGGGVTVQKVPAAQAREEIRQDCKKAYSRNLAPAPSPTGQR